MKPVKSLIDHIARQRDAADEELSAVITCKSDEDTAYLYEKAAQVRRQYYGNDVYIRGLIEISNYCRNDCFYCGIRKSNKNLKRYHLTKEEILSCSTLGYQLGFRTFVMQGGEDTSYSTGDMCDIIAAVKAAYPDCAVTLSLGEQPKAAYQAYRDAGADRYLLRHETAAEDHYQMLHPNGMSLNNRTQCLYDLKEIGYQVGSGFMVGAPGQTIDNLIQDVRFLQELNPSMIGIGPFLPHEDTPFGGYPKGDLTLCLNMVALSRLIFPNALIPATTALGTLHPQGRELGLLAGANVVMPNLSPADLRRYYALYNGKLSKNEESAEGLEALKKQVEDIGYHVVTARGDAKDYTF